MSENIDQTPEMKTVMLHTKKTTRALLKQRHPELGSRASIGKIDYGIEKKNRAEFDPDAADDDYKHLMSVFPYISRSMSRLALENPDVYNEELVFALVEMYNADPAIPSNVLAFASPYNDDDNLLVTFVFADIPLRDERAAAGEFTTIEDVVEPIDLVPPRPVSKVNPFTLLRSAE